MSSTSSAVPTWRDFPEFHHNPVIRELAHNSRWTISDSDKIPINARGLIDTGQIHGASNVGSDQLVTLDELITAYPSVQNCCYWISVQMDQYAVLDIEPHCPPEIARALLTVPHHYSELSFSGKGYHLLVDVPENYQAFPNAMNKAKLRHPQGWYEILLGHWITFTRRPIPQSIWNVTPTQHHTLESVYESLAVDAKPSIIISMDSDLFADQPEIPYFDQVVQHTKDQSNYKKTLDDFAGDHSRYEFGFITHHVGVLHYLIDAIPALRMEQYSDVQKAWIVFRVVTDMLPKRAKHYEQRQGMPFLLWRSVQAVLARSQPRTG